MKIYKLVFSPIQVNTYILSDESGDCAIIDCGCYDQDEFDILNDLILNKNLKPVLLLNTHCHLDHIFGNRFMLEKYNLRSFCHKDDNNNRKSSLNHAKMFGLAMEPPPEPAGYLNDAINFIQTNFTQFTWNTKALFMYTCSKIEFWYIRIVKEFKHKINRTYLVSILRGFGSE